ncbi:MAG: DNA replication and repair protein RecF [Victivallaceae bacterium]|nr:DNA replication and repair protein RecF [Victivallaceae bacterium]
MSCLKELELVNFRNYEKRKFTFESDRVVMIGPNGSGKTNLLESIFFLSILRSFRTVNYRDLVRSDSKAFEIHGLLHGESVKEKLHVFQSFSGMRRFFIGQNQLSRSSDFVNEFRAVVFVPEDRFICSGNSSYRRRFFDMLISRLDREYFSDLAAYYRALMQRNKALKITDKQDVISSFNLELAEKAIKIAEKRRKYAKIVEQLVNLKMKSFADFSFDIKFECDYPEDIGGYLAELDKLRVRESIKHCTLIGPQLDDFDFDINGKAVRNFASNGQIRLLSLMLRLAELDLVGAGCKPIVLVDDVTGELDCFNRERFLESIESADQKFFTFTERPDFMKPGFQEIRAGNN